MFIGKIFNTFKYVLTLTLRTNDEKSKDHREFNVRREVTN